MHLHDFAHAFVPYPDAPVPHASTGSLGELSFGVKDLFDVAGYPTSGGNPIVLAMSGVKTHTATTVQRLLGAGARFVGKTMTDELAFSLSGINAHFGKPVNGAAPTRITGGSSSGSASAVSSGLCDFALGTDTGGSVRAPASHCGLYGLRPTHGRVSLEGALALAPSLDACGWFARDIHTFARVADVLLGPDTVCVRHEPRLLWPTDVWAQVNAAAVETLSNAATEVQEKIAPATPVETVLESWDAMYLAFRYIQGREAWLTYGPLISRHSPPLGSGVAGRFAWSRKVTDAQVCAARLFRTAFRDELAALLGNDGVLLMPTMPDVAPLRNAREHTQETYRAQAMRLLCIAGLSGFPQVTLPMAQRLGAPLGLSLLGPPGSDRSLIALAERLCMTKEVQGQRD